MSGDLISIIDILNLVTDEKIRRYFELGCEVKALDRGHLARLKRENVVWFLSLKESLFRHRVSELIYTGF